MDIKIETVVPEQITGSSIFICAIGFEKRSIYHLNELLKQQDLDTRNVLCFCFKDMQDDVSRENQEFVLNYDIKPVEVYKNEEAKVLETINDKLTAYQADSKPLNIHVDYSSMPRNWYCNIFIKLSECIKQSSSIYFWYSHGDYSSNLNHCSTAGADDIVVFSGKASITPMKRSHLFGIGFDRIKTDAIRTILDPTTLAVCYTYPKRELDINQKLKKQHKYLFDAASLTFSLPIEDYSFMVNRIKDIVLDLKDGGDVILVPDGPKPLILAFSIIPLLLKKDGIVAMHIQSHSNFTPENIIATGKISGFRVTKK